MAQSHKVGFPGGGSEPRARTLVAQSHKVVRRERGFGPLERTLVAQSHKVVRWRGYFVAPEGTPAVDGGSA